MIAFQWEWYILYLHMHIHMHTHTAVGEDVTTYSSLIGEVHEVHDDSSDFELPETVVAWNFC